MGVVLFTATTTPPTPHPLAHPPPPYLAKRKRNFQKATAPEPVGHQGHKRTPEAKCVTGYRNYCQFPWNTGGKQTALLCVWGGGVFLIGVVLNVVLNRPPWLQSLQRQPPPQQDTPCQQMLPGPWPGEAHDPTNRVAAVALHQVREPGGCCKNRFCWLLATPLLCWGNARVVRTWWWWWW